MAFSMVWRSTAGMIQVSFAQPLELGTVHNDAGEPVITDINDMQYWQPHYWDNSTLITQREFNNLQGITKSISDIQSFLTGTSSSSPAKICEFKIKDSTLGPKVSLVLQGYLDNADNIKIRPARYVYDPSDPSIVTITAVNNAWRNVSISSANAAVNKFVAGEFQRNGGVLLGVGCYTMDRNAVQTQGAIFCCNVDSFVRLFGAQPESDEEDPDYGQASTPGGYSGGTFDFHSDPAGIPAKPQYGMISPGFLNAYIVTMAGLQQFGEAIFPDLSPSQIVPTDIVSAVNFLGEIVDFMARTIFNGKLLDYIMDCHILPVTPAATSGQPVTAGGKNFIHPQTGQGYTASLISEDFTDVDCGSITTPGTFCNFLDFENCRAKLFLPFVGYVDIKNEYWHDATLGVYYRFNNIDGSFMCYVTSTSTHSDLDGVVIGQYSGNACIHIPINSRDYSNVISGLVGAVGSAALGAASGGSGVAALAAQQSISDAQSMVNSRPTFSQSNAYSGSGSIMSKRRPHLLIEFPETSFSTKYPSEFGLPLNVAKTIGSCSGYTVAVDPVLDGIPCTDAERERIRQALRNGVIIK